MRTRLLAMATLLAGCASVQVTPLNSPTKPMQPRSASEVEVFVTKAPERAYEEVYLIRADAGDSETALAKMREEGGKLGCDAIVIAGAADRVVSTGDSQGGTTVSTREGFVGSCILYK